MIALENTFYFISCGFLFRIFTHLFDLLISPSQVEALRALLDGGADFSALVKGTTPLHEAAYRGHHEACSAMCRPPVGAIPKKESSRSKQRSSKKKRRATAPAPVNSNAAAVDARNGAGDTPLTVAAREGQLKTVLALLAAGADVHGG